MQNGFAFRLPLTLRLSSIRSGLSRGQRSDTDLKKYPDLGFGLGCMNQGFAGSVEVGQLPQTLGVIAQAPQASSSARSSSCRSA